MKKFVSSLLAAIMLLALALPVSAFAGENAQVELTAQGDRAAVRLQLPANTGKGITALQLTFQVTAPADAQLDFDFADDLPGSVQQVRYQAQQGTLTVYVAGTAQLFSQDQAYLGQLVASGDQEGDVVVKVEQNALRLVNGVNVASRPETAPAETQLTVETPTPPQPPLAGPDAPAERPPRQESRHRLPRGGPRCRRGRSTTPTRPCCSPGWRSWASRTPWGPVRGTARRRRPRPWGGCWRPATWCSPPGACRWGRRTSSTRPCPCWGRSRCSGGSS